MKSEFSVQDLLGPYVSNTDVTKWRFSAANSRILDDYGTDKTDMENTPWSRVRMADDCVTSQCPFVRTNLDFIRVRIEKIQSLRSTCGERSGTPRIARVNGRFKGNNGSEVTSCDGGGDNNTTYTNRSSTGMRTGPSPSRGRYQANEPAKT